MSQRLCKGALVSCISISIFVIRSFSIQDLKFGQTKPRILEVYCVNVVICGVSREFAKTHTVPSSVLGRKGESLVDGSERVYIIKFFISIGER